MSKFVRKVFAVVKNAGYNTNNMSKNEAIEIFDKLEREDKSLISNTDDVPRIVKQKSIFLSKEDYAKLCSIVKTKYTNKIPKTGYVFDDKHFYRFEYNKNMEKIICKGVLQIEGNENLIDMWG